MSNKLPEYVFVPLPTDSFITIFKREESAAPDSNDGCFGEGSKQFQVISTDGPLEKVKGDNRFANNLKNTLRKTLGDRVCTTDDSITVFWKITFVSKSLASVKLSASGGFFEKFLSEYKLPVTVQLWFELEIENDWISIQSGEMSPILSIAKDSTDDPHICVFKATFKQKIGELIPTNVPISTSIAIRISANHNVTSKALPDKMVMGQSILENKIESDFAIIAEDGTRFECHKVFLASNSKVLAGMLQMDCKETKEKAVKLKMSATGINALLKFMYYASVIDPMQSPSIALELLEIGHQCDIFGLEEAMRTLLLAQKNEWFDIDTALLLYLLTLKVDGYEDLKWKALQAFKSKPSDLEGSTVFDKLLKEDSKTGKELIAICFRMK